MINFHNIYVEQRADALLKKLPELVAQFETLMGTKTFLTLADVGGGGELKEPWSYCLEGDYIRKITFDPDDEAVPTKGLLRNYPYCLSDAQKSIPFYLAKDPRASSLNRWSEAFKARFWQEDYATAREFEISCESGDAILHDDAIDLVDINTEGHDYLVVQGMEKTLAGKALAVRTEFQFFPAYEEGHLYGEIEQEMHRLGYELARLEMLESIREAEAQGLVSAGLPVWGKAVWIKRVETMQETILADANPKEKLLRSIVAASMFLMHGHAIRLMQWAQTEGLLQKDDADVLIARYRSHFAEKRFDKLLVLLGYPLRFYAALFKRVMR